MTLFSHALVTAVGVKALNLEGNEMLLAYAFGVLQDLDHLIKVPLYAKKHGQRWRELIRHWELKEAQYNWRTPLQEPVSLLWIIPLSIYLGTPVPIIFFILHWVLDLLVDYGQLPFFPFSNWAIPGFLPNIQTRFKEFTVLGLCLILLLV